MTDLEQASADIDRLHTVIVANFPHAVDEEGATDVDELVEAVEMAGEMIEQYRRIYARVQVVARRNGKCPLCDGRLRSRPSRLEIVHADTCPLYSEEG